MIFANANLFGANRASIVCNLVFRSYAQLYLVDLAGSEKVQITRNILALFVLKRSRLFYTQWKLWQ
jgi:hypothetical protein